MKRITWKILILAIAAGSVCPAVMAQEEERLNVWCWNPDVNFQALGQAAELYGETHPEFQMETVEVSWNEIREALDQAAKTGETDGLPDLLLMQNYGIQKYLTEAPELFTDLTDSGILFSDFEQGAVEFSTSQEKNYGVPFEQGGMIACYRTDLLEELGYTAQDFTDITWGELQAIGERILAENGTPLLSWVKGDPGLILAMVQSAGGSLFDEKGNLNLADNDVLKEAVRTYVSLVDSGVLREIEAWDEYDLYVEELIQGNVLGCVNASGILASFGQAEEQEGKWSVTNLPALENVEGAGNYAGNGGTSWMVIEDGDTVTAVDFLASNFGGSQELYGTLIPLTAVAAAYEPAVQSGVYEETLAVSSDETALSKILEYSEKSLEIEKTAETGTAYYEGADALAEAVNAVLDGTELDEALANAQAALNKK